MKFILAILIVPGIFSSNAFATDSAQVIKCVQELKRYQGFNNAGAAMICKNTQDANAVIRCVDELKRYQGFTNSETTVACGVSCR